MTLGIMEILETKILYPDDKNWNFFVNVKKMINQRSYRDNIKNKNQLIWTTNHKGKLGETDIKNHKGILALISCS